MIPRIVALLTLTIAFTVVHGAMTHRWSTPDTMQESIKFIDQLPKQLGDWHYVEDSNDLSDAVVKELGVTGYESRRYSNGDQHVSLLLMTGWTARLIRHTPDICFASTGNTFQDEPTPNTIVVDGAKQELLVLPITPRSGTSDEFAVVYGFLHNGVFSATRNPRVEYHGTPVVQKIQLLCEPDAETPTSIPPAAADFITQLVRYCMAASSE
jgi:Protein of unknown function (DUF3485)